MQVLLVLAGILALLILAGVAYQALGTARDARRYPPPGRMVDVGACRLHLNESPDSMSMPGPCVVLEAGIAASSLSWTRVQPEVAKFARVVSYDRAGLGWSELSPGARTPQRLADELHALLDGAGVPRPLVLVGHSFGGYCVRMYAHKYPGEVAGMVLVDAVHPSEWMEPSPQQRRMIQGGVLFSHIGAFLASIGFVRFCLERLAAGKTGAPKLAARSFGESAEKFLGRIVGEVRKLPEEWWPCVRANWCLPRSFLSMARHVASLPESAAQVAATRGLGEMPLMVLSGSHHSEPRQREQAALARLSVRSTHLVAAESCHWIHLDEPELVVRAIREVVEQARTAMQGKP